MTKRSTTCYVFKLPMTIFDPASGKSPEAPSTYNTDNIQFHTVENAIFFNFFAHRKCHKGGIYFRLQWINFR
jgi:hypothetical protein